MNKVIKVWRWWDKLWFAPTDLLKIGLFRFALGLIMLVMYSIRAFGFKMFFTDKGLILASQARDILPGIYRPTIQLFSASEQVTVILYVLFILAIILMILGIGGRLTTFVTLLLHLSFIQRDFPVIYGVELMITFWLFYLSLVENNRYFSVWNLWAKGRLSLAPVYRSDLLSSVGVRLMKLQLCIIYAYSGMEKLKGLPWWEGSAVWSVLGNRQLMTADYSILQNVPVLIAFLTWSTLMFEIYFPVLIWYPPLKKWVLRFGVAFHVGIVALMGLFSFSAVMITSYCSFLDDSSLRHALHRLSPKSFQRFIAAD